MRRPVAPTPGGVNVPGATSCAIVILVLSSVRRASDSHVAACAARGKQRLTTRTPGRTAPEARDINCFMCHLNRTTEPRASAPPQRGIGSRDIHHGEPEVVVSKAAKRILGLTTHALKLERQRRINRLTRTVAWRRPTSTSRHSPDGRAWHRTHCASGSSDTACSRPPRTAGGQRRYTETDVQRVEWLRDRIRAGWRIGEAARVLDEAGCAALADPGGAPRRADRVDPRGSEPLAGWNATLDQAFAVLSLGQALTDVVIPALRWTGDAWDRGELTVAQEHAITAKVRARLGNLISDGRGSAHGVAVLACGPGEQHDLGLLMLAVMLRADGWRVEFLGADTPVASADCVRRPDRRHDALPQRRP